MRIKNENLRRQLASKSEFLLTEKQFSEGLLQDLEKLRAQARAELGQAISLVAECTEGYSGYSQYPTAQP